MLSAGEPLPSAILVHDYLTVEGRKLSKSAGDAVGRAELAERYGADALRWWFLRDVPRAGDADFREELLAARADELADGLGNLVNRTIALLAPFRLPREGSVPAEGGELARTIRTAPGEVDAALARFDLRAATEAVWAIALEANRFVSATRPWELARAERGGDRAASERLDAVLALLLAACRALAAELRPFHAAVPLVPRAHVGGVRMVWMRREPPLHRASCSRAAVASGATYPSSSTRSGSGQRRQYGSPIPTEPPGLTP